MTRAGSIILLGLTLVIGVVGCKGDGATADATSGQPVTPTITTPRKTAAENQKSLANANMPPEAKAVMGGTGGGGAGAPAAGSGPQ